MLIDSSKYDSLPFAVVRYKTMDKTITRRVKNNIISFVKDKTFNNISHILLDLNLAEFMKSNDKSRKKMILDLYNKYPISGIAKEARVFCNYKTNTMSLASSIELEFKSDKFVTCNYMTIDANSNTVISYLYYISLDEKGCDLNNVTEFFIEEDAKISHRIDKTHITSYIVSTEYDQAFEEFIKGNIIEQ